MRTSTTPLPVLVAAGGLLLAAVPPASAAQPERLHTVTVSAAEGRFRCGELLLTVVGGTQTETVDGRLKDGVAHVRIERAYDDVVLAGSDGRDYRATSHVSSVFVLVAPDLENPVRGDELIHVSFHGAQGSPGHLEEHLRIRDGIETDEVTGTCGYAD
jgi:hypothetical protein